MGGELEPRPSCLAGCSHGLPEKGGCSLFSELLRVLFEVVNDQLKLLLSHFDGTLVVVALAAIDDLVDNLFEGVHVLKLIVHDAAFDKLIRDLMRAVSDLLIHFVLIVKLLFLADELLLVNREQISIEGFFDLRRFGVDVHIDLSFLLNHLLDFRFEHGNLSLDRVVDCVLANIQLVVGAFCCKGCLENVQIDACEFFNLLGSWLLVRGKQGLIY